MPLEALTCTNCGSPDLNEVKSHVFFCNSCDTVFKYSDPTRPTLLPAFCGCGNQIQYQCNVCQSGMCGACNQTLNRHGWHISNLDEYESTYSRGRDDEYPHGRIATVGFGIRAWDAEGKDLDLLFLTRYQVWIAAGRPLHICLPCLKTFVPKAAEMIKEGLICAAASCHRSKYGLKIGTKLERCPSCGYSFCCSSTPVDRYKIRGVNLSTTIPSRLGLTVQMDREGHHAVEEFYIKVTETKVLYPCGPCEKRFYRALDRAIELSPVLSSLRTLRVPELPRSQNSRRYRKWSEEREQMCKLVSAEVVRIADALAGSQFGYDDETQYEEMQYWRRICDDSATTEVRALWHST